QLWSERDPSALALPQHSQLRLPGGVGLGAAVDLALGLAELRAGDYSRAADAAHQAQEAIDGMSGSGQIARLVEVVARAASGDYAGASRLLADVERNGEMSPEAHLDRAFVRVHLGDYTGANADLDSVIEDRDATDHALSLAHL